MPVLCGISPQTGQETLEEICDKRIEEFTFYTSENSISGNPRGSVTLKLSGATGNDFTYIRVGNRYFYRSDANYSSSNRSYYWFDQPYLALNSSFKIIYRC